MLDKTHFLKALRPFSFIVAISSCLLGVVLGYLDGFNNIFLASLLLFTGVVLQAGVNLINDYSDRHNAEFNLQQQQRISRNMKIGVSLFIIVLLSGLYMISIRGIYLFLLGLIGLLGAIGYTSGKINYKHKGMGVVLVFFLMGIMMIGGCYYVMTGAYTWIVFLLSLPFSFFTSLLLLANEIRDYEEDSNNNILTLTVRIGFINSTKLYIILLTLICLISVSLYWYELLPTLFLLCFSLFALPAPIRILSQDIKSRISLPQLTGRLYLVYSMSFIMTIVMETF